MNAMMRQLGIDVKDVENVQQVVIRTPTQELVFDKPSVTIMTAQGQKTYQVVGTPRTVTKGGATPHAPASVEPPKATKMAPVVISEEDIRMVAEQSGRSPQEARAMLQETNGDLAEAIVRLTGAED